MSAITWLHLSDLHFRADNLRKWDEDIVLRALLDDVAERRAQDGLCPDLILVSGDLAYSGQVEEYALARAFFDDLLRATGLPRDRLLVVPGNHDADRKEIDLTTRALAATINSRETANEALADAVARQLLMKRFAGYASFVNGYLGHLPFDSDRYFYVHSLDLPRCRLAVLGLNSAWLAQGGEEDRHKLALSECQVRASLDLAGQTSGPSLCLAMLHHPFDWLAAFDRTDCETLLTDNCDLILHGHLHQVDLRQVDGPDCQTFVIAAGATYETRRQANAYNLVRLDPESGQGAIYLRAYSDRRGGFWTKDVANYRQVSDGVYRFTLPECGARNSPPGTGMASKPSAPAGQQVARASGGSAAVVGRGAATVGNGNMVFTGDMQGGVTIVQREAREDPR